MPSKRNRLKGHDKKALARLTIIERAKRRLVPLKNRSNRKQLAR